MSRYEKNKLEYIVMCVFMFARRQGIGVRPALRYLLDGKGISYLESHYDIEHTLSLEDTLDTLEIICRKNGGALA